jgi:nicotinate phosphoribosyltransferase
LSPITAPGAKQVHRRAGQRDLIALRTEPSPPDGDPLLVPMLRGGRRIHAADTVAEAHRRFRRDLNALPPAARLIRRPVPPRACHSAALDDLTRNLTRRLAAAAQEENTTTSMPRIPRPGNQ